MVACVTILLNSAPVKLNKVYAVLSYSIVLNLLIQALKALLVAILMPEPSCGKNIVAFMEQCS